MKTLNASTFKARCLAVLDEVAETGEAYLITKRGKEVARILPPTAARDGSDPQAALRGTAEILGDIVSPVVPPDWWDAVAGRTLPEPTAKRRRSRQ